MKTPSSNSQFPRTTVRIQEDVEEGEVVDFAFHRVNSDRGTLEDPLKERNDMSPESENQTHPPVTADELKRSFLEIKKMKEKELALKPAVVSTEGYSDSSGNGIEEESVKKSKELKEAMLAIIRKQQVEVKQVSSPFVENMPVVKASLISVAPDSSCPSINSFFIPMHSSFSTSSESIWTPPSVSEPQIYRPEIWKWRKPRNWDIPVNASPLSDGSFYQSVLNATLAVTSPNSKVSPYVVGDAIMESTPFIPLHSFYQRVPTEDSLSYDTAPSSFEIENEFPVFYDMPTRKPKKKKKKKVTLPPPQETFDDISTSQSESESDNPRFLRLRQVSHLWRKRERQLSLEKEEEGQVSKKEMKLLFFRHHDCPLDCRLILNSLS